MKPKVSMIVRLSSRQDSLSIKIMNCAFFCLRKHPANGKQVTKPGIETFTIPCNLDITLEKVKARELYSIGPW